MQAIINGVTVTGTPQEIAEYQRIVATNKKPYGPWVKPDIICDGIGTGSTKGTEAIFSWNGPSNTKMFYMGNGKWEY